MHLFIRMKIKRILPPEKDVIFLQMNSKRVHVLQSSPAADYLRIINERNRKNILITELPSEESQLNIINHLK